MGFDLFSSVASVGAQWFWEKQGKTLASKAWGKLKEKWYMFRWQEAENNYRALLRGQHSTTRLLGNVKTISIEGIFTSVYVLDKLTAVQRFNFEQLRGLPFRHEDLQIPLKRRPAVHLAINEKRLFILGKPGAGKTTLLRYITLQACAGNVKRTPIFISMKDWADSHLDLLPFLALQFKICFFPDTEAFIEQLLAKGNVSLLFDGLDEVNIAQRQGMIQTINKISKLHRDIQIVITCRIAATDYMFERFTYLEIADFDDGQIRLFASKWYQNEPSKLKEFLAEFEKPGNKGLRELARTPLLLTLLCLAFDNSLKFPSRRVELYKEALDALLKRWDSTRGIQRDNAYQNLTAVQKEQMLAYIAKQNFEESSYFIRVDTLTRQIENFLQKSSPQEFSLPDGEAILKAIEAQHGILVERAYGIYSFSHLTFQEYFTARFLANNADRDTLAAYINLYITDDRWREVLLLTTSLLDNADAFLNMMLEKTALEGRINANCKKLINWVFDEAGHYGNAAPAARCFLLFSTLAQTLKRLNTSVMDFPGTKARNKKITQQLNICCEISLASSLYLARHIDIDINTAKANARKITSMLSSELGIRSPDYPRWDPSLEDAEQITEYMYANEILIECMKLASLSNRSKLEMQLLSLNPTKV